MSRGPPDPWYVAPFEFGGRQLAVKFREHHGRPDQMQLIAAATGEQIQNPESLRRAMRVAAEKFIADRGSST